MENLEQPTTPKIPALSRRSVFIGIIIFFSGILVGMGVVISFLIIKYGVAVAILPDSTTSSDKPSPQVLGLQLTQCCSCPTMINSSQIGKSGWILYEQGKDYTALRPKICSSPNIGACAPCPPLETKRLPCQYNDKTYKSGETIPIDKCNQCSCEDGQIACTLMACE